MFAENDLISVYIPDVDGTHNKQSVMSVFDEYDIGQVERVDFVPHKECRGYEIFVHFLPFDTHIMEQITNLHAVNGSYRLMVGINEQWLICRNHNPLPDTKMNIHQVANHSKELEKSLVELKKAVEVIPEITNTLHSLNARIKYLEDPEWLNYMSSPITMLDLSTRSNIIEDEYQNSLVGNLGLERVENPSGSVGYSPIMPIQEERM